MPSQIHAVLATDETPEFVPFGVYLACVQSTNWTDWTVKLYQSVDPTDDDSWVQVGSDITANAIVALKGGLHVKATKADGGSATGTITINIAKSAS